MSEQHQFNLVITCSQKSLDKLLADVKSGRLSQLINGSVDDVLVLSAPALGTKISNWIQGVYDALWQPPEVLASSIGDLGFAVRSIGSEFSGGKILTWHDESVALRIDAELNSDETVSIIARILKLKEKKFLPYPLVLNILSDEGNLLFSVTTGEEDVEIRTTKLSAPEGTFFYVNLYHADTLVYEEKLSF